MAILKYNNAILFSNDLQINVEQLTTNSSLTYYDVEVTASLGVPPYSGTGITYNLSAGTYTFEVTDSTGDTASTNFTVTDTLGYKPEYDFNFNENSTSYGFQSVHTGEIIEVELTNIDSYTINKSTPTIPGYTINNNDVYIIDIIKTNSELESTIKFTIGLYDYTETINSVDFTIGDGKKTYALSSTINSVYKLDNELLTSGNTSGVGTWTSTPLESTIILPTITGGTWYKIVYVKDNKIVVMGCNDVSSNNLHYCYINTDDSITDLDGNLNTYTTYVGSFNTTYVRNYFYDYLNNYLIINPYVYENLWPFLVDLNTNLTYKPSAVYNFRRNYVKENVYFNPYKETFVEIDAKINRTNVIPAKWINRTASSSKLGYNRNTGAYILPYYNSLSEIDEDSIIIRQSTATKVGAANPAGCYNLTLDHINNVVVSCHSNNNFAIWRLDEINNRSYVLTNPDGVNTILLNGLFAYGDLHIITTCSTGYGTNETDRLHCIDTSNPSGTTQPDFNYYEFTNLITDITINRIL